MHGNLSYKCICVKILIILICLKEHISLKREKEPELMVFAKECKQNLGERF